MNKSLDAFHNRRGVIKAIAAGGMFAHPLVAHSVEALDGKKGRRDDRRLAGLPVSLIGLPYLFGTRMPNVRYGMARGPVEILNYANGPLALRKVFDDVEVKLIDDIDEPDQLDRGADFRLLPMGDQWARQLAQNIVLSNTVASALKRGRIPVTITGGCSYSPGMVGGVSQDGGEIGMLFFDAHSDAGTPETSANGFIEGMPVSMIAGKCYPRYMARIPGFRPIPEERIITIGLNEAYDPNGRKGVSGAGPHIGNWVVLPDIQVQGIVNSMKEPLRALRQRCSQLFIHIDCDVIDSSVLLAHKHTPARGITDSQLTEILAYIGEQFEIRAVNFSSWDPQVDVRGTQVIPGLIVAAAKAQALSRLRRA